MTSMIVVTVAHRSIKIVNKLLRLRIVGFVTLLSSDRITNCYQVFSRHHVKVRVLPAKRQAIENNNFESVNSFGKNQNLEKMKRRLCDRC